MGEERRPVTFKRMVALVLATYPGYTIDGLRKLTLRQFFILAHEAGAVWVLQAAFFASGTGMGIGAALGGDKGLEAFKDFISEAL